MMSEDDHRQLGRRLAELDDELWNIAHWLHTKDLPATRGNRVLSSLVSIRTRLSKIIKDMHDIADRQQLGETFARQAYMDPLREAFTKRERRITEGS